MIADDPELGNQQPGQKDPPSMGSRLEFKDCSSNRVLVKGHGRKL